MPIERTAIVTYDEAATAGLRDAMEEDPTIVLFGPDVTTGGPGGTTTMLLDAFGAERVIDAPAASAVSQAMGAALTGRNPVVDIGPEDFVRYGLANIVRYASESGHWRNGNLYLPLAIRIRLGGPPTAEQIGLVGWLVGIPGFRIALPSNPSDCYRLVRSAIRHDYPSFVIEDASLAGMRGEVWPTGAAAAGGSFIARAGTDVTVVATSRLVQEALRVADELAAQGVSVEVIDMRWLVPLDIDGIAAAATRTRHVVVAHEGTAYGPNAELASRIAEHAHGVLAAPVARVEANVDRDGHITRPGADELTQAILRVLGRNEP